MHRFRFCLHQKELGTFEVSEPGVGSGKIEEVSTKSEMEDGEKSCV